MWTAKQLKEYRAKKGLTQVAFGKKIGLTGQYIAMIETGQREVSRHILQKIANSFKEEFVIKISPITKERV